MISLAFFGLMNLFNVYIDLNLAFNARSHFAQNFSPFFGTIAIVIALNHFICPQDKVKNFYDYLRQYAIKRRSWFKVITRYTNPLLAIKMIKMMIINNHIELD